MSASSPAPEPPTPRDAAASGCRRGASGRSGSCRRSSSGVALDSFEAVARHYRENGRKSVRWVLSYYASLPSLEEAAEAAGRAALPDGKRHPHQYRIRERAMEEMRAALPRIKKKLVESADFAALFAIVEGAVGGICGIGKLTVYDTALRLGAYLGKRPQVVYLHRGTREGAKALGIGCERRVLETKELPEPLRELEPHELEDLLCIYKEELRRIAENAEG